MNNDRSHESVPAMPTEPLVELWAKRQEIARENEKPTSDRVHDVLFGELCRLDDKMIEMPARTLEGVRAKLEMAYEWFRILKGEEYFEPRHLAVASAIADLKRMASAPAG